MRLSVLAVGACALGLYVVAASCSPKSEPVAVGVEGARPIGSPPKSLELHPNTEAPDVVAKKKAETASSKAPPLDVKINPAVVGEYRLVLKDEQVKQIDAAIAKLQSDVDGGKEEARPALEMAKAARELSRKLVVRLLPNGRYTAELGSGETGGTYKTGPGIVLLRPDDQTNDPADPKDMQMFYDAAQKSLTVEFRGETMVLARKG